MHASTEQELHAIATAEDIDETIRVEISHWANTQVTHAGAVALRELHTELMDAIGKLFAPSLEELAQRRKQDGRQDQVNRISLDPRDPFDAVLIPMVEMNRKQRADYAQDGDAFDNFRTSSHLMGLNGFGAIEAGLFNITQKMARLKSLRANGRMDDPKNEAVEDTYLDLAVYAVLTYAMARNAAMTEDDLDGPNPW